jgi:CARDB
MISRVIAWLGVMMILSRPSYAESRSEALPDLRVRTFEFLAKRKSSLRVQIANYGLAEAAICSLLLTVRQSDGVSAQRATRVRVPPIPAGKYEWVSIDALSILPKTMSLQDTTFRLEVDATQVVRELDESNNQIWYNPKTLAKKAPDLRVRDFEFPSSATKAVKVEVGNYGEADAGHSVLRLTILRIKAASVERTTSEGVPPVRAGSSTWVVIEASGILRENLPLMGTTFTLDVDAAGTVSESDEANNETWHRHPRPQ